MVLPLLHPGRDESQRFCDFWVVAAVYGIGEVMVGCRERNRLTGSGLRCRRMRAVGEKPADGKRGRVVHEPIKQFYSLY